MISLYLASNSLRRRELLKNMGYDFKTIAIYTDETFPDSLKVEDIPAFLAKQKAEAVRWDECPENSLLIMADTMVLLDGKIMDKPKNEEEAFSILSELSEKKHQVITGVCIRSRVEEIIFSDTTDVYFNRLDEEDIRYYIKHYPPLDKAGAYGIQEWIGMIGISAIRGSYYNVMGLPTEKLYKALKTFGCEPTHVA